MCEFLYIYIWVKGHPPPLLFANLPFHGDHACSLSRYPCSCPHTTSKQRECGQRFFENQQIVSNITGLALFFFQTMKKHRKNQQNQQNQVLTHSSKIAPWCSAKTTSKLGFLGFLGFVGFSDVVARFQKGGKFRAREGVGQGQIFRFFCKEKTLKQYSLARGRPSGNIQSSSEKKALNKYSLGRVGKGTVFKFVF